MTSTPDADAFYVAEAEGVYRATEAAQGPWDPGSQHGGPPAALLASAVEERTGRPGLRTVRVSVDFFGPIPMGVVGVSVRVLRPGRRVQLAEAELTHAGKVVAVARTWQHAVSEGAASSGAASSEGTPSGAAPSGAPSAEASRAAQGVAGVAAGPGGRPPVPALPPRESHGPGMMNAFGYGRAIEWRMTGGSADALGPGAVWARPRVPLIAGTEMTGLQRALVVADSANGISLSLPLDHYLSMPTSLNVAFLRHPAGDWVHLDCRTDFSGDGVGLTTAELADFGGRLGVVNQPLLIVARG